MNKNESDSKVNTMKSMVLVIISNVIIGISGILAGFFVPKALGVFEYGYYKTFSLYAGYVTFLLLGVTNGIFLFYAGKHRDELPVEKIRFVSRFVILLQLLIAIFLGLLSFCFLNYDFKIFFIVLALGLYVFAFNILNYFTIVAQSVLEFNKVVIKNFVSGLLTIASALTVFITFKISGNYIRFELYVSMVLASYLLLALWICFDYRVLIFGKACCFKEGQKELTILIKNGIIMMIADFISSIFLHLDLQFVNVLFEINVFSIYSFAYSIISLIVTVIASASTVLYPALKTLTLERVKDSYSNIVTVIAILVSLFLSTFFAVSYVVSKFLPEYIKSLSFLALLFPTIIPITFVKVCMYNYFQAYKKIYHCLFINLSVFAFSALLNFVFYLIFKTPESISIASIISLTLYYLVYLFFTKKIMNVKIFKDLSFVILNMAIFYTLYFIIGNSVVCFMCVFLSQLSLCMIYYGKTLLTFFHNRIKQFKKNDKI